MTSAPPAGAPDKRPAQLLVLAVLVPLVVTLAVIGVVVALADRDDGVGGAAHTGPLDVAPQESTLGFELSMHPGMDGWHDIAVRVPLQGAAGDDTLTLAVTGDFRDA